MSLKTICSSLGCVEARTDEEYRRMLHRRQRLFVGMLILGIVTLTVAGLAELLEWEVAPSSHSLGFYSGVGTGMAFGAGVLLFRLRRVLKDPEKLRKARISDTDERVVEISRRAIAAAGYVLLLAVYLIGLIGGLFYPELLAVLAVLAMVFLLTYVISYFIYNRIM